MSLQPYNTDSAITFGQEHLESTDFVPPRVKVIQQMSAEATREEDPLKPGELYNTLTGVSFGTRLEFVPLFPFKNRVFILRDEKRAEMEAIIGLEFSENNGLKCRSLDMHVGVGEPGIRCDQCPLGQWRRGAKGENLPPPCSETYNVAAVTGAGELVILQFAKSSASMGRKMFSMLRMSTESPWSKVYEVVTQRTSNARGTFFVPTVRLIGPSSDDQKRMALEWQRQLRGVGPIDVTPESMDDEEATAASPF